MSDVTFLGSAAAAPAAARAGRRGGRDHAVERPALSQHREARAGAGGGLHRGAEARARHAVERHAPRQARVADRPPARRAEHRGVVGPRARRDALERPARRPRHLHRLHRDRPARDGARLGDGEEGVPRARRQVREHRARRRGPREGAAGHGDDVRARRAGLRDHHAPAAAALALRRGRRDREGRLRGLALRRPDGSDGAARARRSAGASRSACSRTSRRGSRRARAAWWAAASPTAPGFFVEPTLFVDVGPRLDARAGGDLRAGARRDPVRRRRRRGAHREPVDLRPLGRGAQRLARSARSRSRAASAPARCR